MEKVTFYPIKHISKYENVIDEMCKDGHLTPFQNYQWQSLLVKQFLTNKVMRATAKSILAVLMDDFGNVKMIVPLYFKRGRKPKTIYILGSGTESDYLDFIYFKDVNKSDFETFFLALSEKYGDMTFKFDLIKENSELLKYLKSKQETVILSKNPCVELRVELMTDSHIQKLTKKTRQNIRTAYNRLESDNLKHNFIYCPAGNIDKNTRKSMFKTYKKRYKIKNSEISFLFKVKMLFRKSVTVDALNEAVKLKLDISVILFYIGDDIAAFGLVLFSENKNTLLVPRVSINIKYGRYSPGILMFNELINHLQSSIMNVENRIVIDLTNGEEQYKYSLGGVTTYNYSGKIKLKNEKNKICL